MFIAFVDFLLEPFVCGDVRWNICTFSGYIFSTVHVCTGLHTFMQNKHANSHSKGEWEKSQAQPHSYLNLYTLKQTHKLTNAHIQTYTMHNDFNLRHKIRAQKWYRHKLQTHTDTSHIHIQTDGSRHCKHTNTKNHACSTNKCKQRVKSEL